VATAAAPVAPSAGAVFRYFTPLTLLVFLVLPNGFLLDIATSFMLKNELRATPDEVAQFRLLTAVPVYLSVCFGLARDLWNPCGLRDRGLLMIFGTATALLFAWIAQAPLSYHGLLVGMLLVMFSFSFVAAAARGLLTLVSQEQLMSGRLSALWNALSSVPYAVGAFASGYLAAHMLPARTFLLVAAMSAAIASLGLWKPSAVFNHAYDQPLARGAGFLGDLKRLARHRAAYPAVLLVCLSQFSPGFNTPLQFYLTNDLRLPDSAYAYSQGLLNAAYIPAAIVYGFLCKRLALRTLLWAATLLWLPAAIPLLFINSDATALWLSFLVGLANGFAFAAFWDLAMRSSPPGLQGTLMMMVAGMYELAYRGGDVVGASIYASSATHGFMYCVVAGTGTSLLMVPLLFLIPKPLIATADGERNPAVEADVLAEIGVLAPAKR
jgi:predicted MFS family arabinose efflux permease